MTYIPKHARSKPPSAKTLHALSLIGTMHKDGYPITAYQAAALAGVSRGTLYKHIVRQREAKG